MLLCGIDISLTMKKQLFSSRNGFKHLIPVNAEGFVKANNDQNLMRILNANYTTIDGQIPLWLYKLKYPKQKIEKLSGSDIIYDFCNWASRRRYKVFLLGGKKESNSLALSRLKEIFPNLIIEGYSPDYELYPFSIDNAQKIRNEISNFAPQILFVGFGMGKQEFWIDDNRDFLEDIGVDWGIGCGGTFEFVAGKINRAPVFIQKTGLESIWRLLSEPKLFRLKRILVSFRMFLYL